MNRRHPVIFILSILAITTIAQSKSLFSKSTKEYIKLPQSTLSLQNSNNVTQLTSNSHLSTSPLAFLKKSIPRKILSCMTQFNVFRCMKVYILQKLETSRTNENIAKNISVTVDFFNRIVCDKNDDEHHLNDLYYKLTDKELNKRMYLGFKQFFGDREIKIQLTPGIIIKVVSSENDLLDVSLKKQLVYNPSDGGLASRKNKNKYFQYMMKMGVPAIFLPMALLGSFLPMILPGLKMATLFTGAVNNAAFVAALMYLARTASLENEQKNTVYYTSGSTHK